jgi:hypothetical protein
MMLQAHRGHEEAHFILLCAATKSASSTASQPGQSILVNAVEDWLQVSCHVKA